ncbi:hypothetical protein [Spirochaeta thermophila]|uniref:hypothetical protein n=1 Tax=Winmispira thermophila TaxID=154 RepID=UPI0012DD7673|nr:hypothetical protein [Spirochaeta thermophila]
MAYVDRGEVHVQSREGNPRVVFLCRQAYILRTMEVPPLPKEEVRRFVGYRIRKLYPGSEDEVIVDAFARMDGTGNVPVIVVPRDLVIRLQKLCPSAKVGTIVDMFVRPPGDFARMVVLEDHLEVVRYREGRWSHVEEGPVTDEALGHWKTRLLKETPRLQVVYSSGLRSIVEDLAGEGVDLLEFDRAISRDFLSEGALGVPSRGIPWGRWATVVALTGVLILNVGLATSQGIMREEIRYYRNVVERSREVLGVLQGLRKKSEEAGGNTSASEKGLRPYRFISRVRESTELPLQIFSVSIDRSGAFTLQAETTDALLLMKQLAASGYFSELGLSGVQRTLSGRERCGLKGVFHDTP